MIRRRMFGLRLVGRSGWNSPSSRTAERIVDPDGRSRLSPDDPLDINPSPAVAGRQPGRSLEGSRPCDAPSVPLTAEEACWDLENALDILRRNLELDSIDYGDASDEVRSAVQHVEVAVRILGAAGSNVVALDRYSRKV